MKLKELSYEEQKNTNGGGLLIYAAILGLYMGYKEMEREMTKK